MSKNWFRATISIAGDVVDTCESGDHAGLMRAVSETMIKNKWLSATVEFAAFIPPHTLSGYSKTQPRELSPIPVEIAKDIAHDRGYDQVIIIARNTDLQTTSVSYGIMSANQDVADHLGKLCVDRIQALVNEELLQNNVIRYERQ